MKRPPIWRVNQARRRMAMERGLQRRGGGAAMMGGAWCGVMSGVVVKGFGQQTLVNGLRQLCSKFEKKPNTDLCG